MSLFDFVGEEDKKDYEVHYPNVEEFPKEVLLGFEKEVLGIYLSGHPLEDYLGKMKKMSRQMQRILSGKRKAAQFV